MNRRAGHFARVIIPSPLKEPLTYNVPAELKDFVSAGMRVLIPLGKRKVSGIVLDLIAETDLAETKDILSVLDPRPIVDAPLLKLSQWIAQYYLASVGEVLLTALPPNSRIEAQRIVIATSDEPPAADPLAKKILEVVHAKKRPVTVKTLARELGGTKLAETLERLQSIGAVEIRERLPGQRHRKRTDYPEEKGASCISPQANLTLSAEQQAALRSMADRLQNGGFETFLLHGVTGSGKTEVYLQAIERVGRAGRQSLILTPEISLTPQLLDRLRARFPGDIGVLHSGLTAAERWSQWWKINRGDVHVVVGARSAVFAPMSRLGLIIVDEEHDGSYKQDEGLRYNGRDVAVMRGKLSQCPVILGSATPSLESYENCRQSRYRLLEISHRVLQRPLPTIKIIDLRGGRKALEFQAVNGETEPTPPASTPAGHLVSEALSDAIVRNFQASRQTLIFLNRRGFANFLQCKLCGYVWRCSYCSVTLTLHHRRKQVRCHHCDFSRPASELCPNCGNDSLAGVGAGTEQIEKILRNLLPDARIERMDRDTTSKRGSHEKLIRRWHQGDVDILIGTQMITKGHDVSGVTLVGVLLADISLNLPDFRSAERTFQLLSQVAGRSGRGDSAGTVIVQTYDPGHYAIRPLLNHDYKNFFAAEIELRQALGYPPFGKLVNLRLDGPKAENVEAKARALVAMLRDAQRDNPKYGEQIEILGPAPAPIEKLRNRYRWQVLLKGKQIGPLLELARSARERFSRLQSVRMHVDVDPYNML